MLLIHTQQQSTLRFDIHLSVTTPDLDYCQESITPNHVYPLPVLMKPCLPTISAYVIYTSLAMQVYNACLHRIGGGAIYVGPYNAYRLAS